MALFDKIFYFLNNFWYPFLYYLFFLTFLLLILKLIFGVKKLKYKLIYANIIIFFILSLNIIYFFEAYFRFVYDKTDGLRVLLTSQQWLKRNVYERNEVILPEGFRDTKNYNNAANDANKKIVVVGDSFSYGYGIKNIQDRFSNILENQLIVEGYKVSVYNFGVQGAGIAEEKRLVDSAIKNVKPDLIIWQYFMDDLISSPSAQLLDFKKKTWLIQSNPLGNDLMSRSFVFNYVYYRLSPLLDNNFFNQFIYQIDLYNNQQVWDRSKNKIVDTVRDTKLSKTPLVVIIFPFMNLVGNNYPLRDAHIKLDQIFRDENVPFVDLMDLYDNFKAEEVTVNNRDFHPNEKAHGLAEKELYNLLKSHDILNKYLKN